MTDDATPGALRSNAVLGPAAPKRCEPCRATGAVHCSDPENCGGPWDKMHDEPPEREECDVPPFGWRCTRVKGHEGPCAAVECPEDIEGVEKAMKRWRAGGA